MSLSPDLIAAVHQLQQSINQLSSLILLANEASGLQCPESLLISDRVWYCVHTVGHKNSHQTQMSDANDRMLNVSWEPL